MNPHVETMSNQTFAKIEKKKKIEKKEIKKKEKEKNSLGQ